MTPHDAIRNARKSKGITLKKMSKTLGIPLTAINSWERGSGLPKADNRAKVAKFLGIDEKEISPASIERNAVRAAMEDYETKPIMLHKNVWRGFEDLKLPHEDVSMFLARIYSEILTNKK